MNVVWIKMSCLAWMFNSATTLNHVAVTRCVARSSLVLTLSPPIPLKLFRLSYWSNPPFLIFDIRAFWRSGLSVRAPECQKIKNVWLDQYGAEPNLKQLALKVLTLLNDLLTYKYQTDWQNTASTKTLLSCLEIIPKTPPDAEHLATSWWRVGHGCLHKTCSTSPVCIWRQIMFVLTLDSIDMSVA